MYVYVYIPPFSPYGKIRPAQAGEASWHAVGQSACGLNGWARRPRRPSTSWGLYSNVASWEIHYQYVYHMKLIIFIIIPKEMNGWFTMV